MTKMTECNNFEITLHNFQSISDANLEFKEGINLIVGQSNSGKTATLRAVKAAVLNPSGSQRFIKKGTEESSVELLHRNNNIKWTRNKKESKFTINDEDYIKVGNSNLFKLLDNSGFIVDDKNNLMNIEGELELPFPFDRNSSELFKLFENIFCVSDSAVILKAIKDEEDSGVRSKNRLVEDRNKLILKLSALEELKSEVSIDKLKNFKIEYADLIKNNNKLIEDFKSLNNSCSLVTKLNLGESKEPIFSKELSDKYAKYISRYKDIYRCSKLVSILKEDNSSPCLDASIVKKYSSLINDYDSICKVQKLSNSEFKDISIDSSAIDKLLKMRKDFKSFGVLIKLSKLFKEEKEVILTTDNVNKLEKLTNDYAYLLGAEKTIMSFEERIKEKEKELDKVNKELEKFDVCPLCGNTLTHEKGN